jgi:plastocyanin
MLSWAAAFALAGAAWSGQVTAAVSDSKGAPIEGAIVYVRSVKGSFPPPAEPYVMDQVDLDFAPGLLPVLVGGKVAFPNKDQVQHQLYSLSAAKKFELPLYKGRPADPVVFDKPGVVKLGCNIHDWMSGAILVLQNPYFAATGKDGKATLKEVPQTPGLELAVFHPRLRGEPDKTAKPLKWKGKSASASWSLDLRPEMKKKRPDVNPYSREYGGSDTP